jgi:hypothetical protein
MSAVDRWIAAPITGRWLLIEGARIVVLIPTLVLLFVGLIFVAIAVRLLMLRK